ncbi:MAG: DUF3179 domain-containing protein [Proteobacteria bacterium]|nr:DUF3179 domain-containing protein [Pseudomonadota bacterium]
MGCLTLLLVTLVANAAGADSGSWKHEWPRTDFTRHSVDYSEIVSGGPPKDGIPAIDDPRFAAAMKVEGLAPQEPVISIQMRGEARAYPLRILIWHEIVNDTVGDTPIAVTWCPLCNSAVAFDRRAGGKILSFGTTGKLRHSDLVMYDRQSESWWQQFTGECIVGEQLGAKLTMIPLRVESVERFQTRFPQGRIMVPPAFGRRNYGTNPYAGYDRSARPFLYRGSYDGPLPPLARVVVVDGAAWALDLLMKRRRIEAGDLVLTWEPGQASPLDAQIIEAGREIGNVVVQRRRGDALDDVVHDVSFAFAFRAFYPDGPLHVE